ncbi:hypothetical protein GCM10011415_36500 [Salipiger pallidus]|uniref:Uncharacterized protein n=1 Tax=Salipiger pallidus TaxID=1775170 RepID=A0A8J2ZN42_9RHOB|nr:hypothetical protein GCM10011415_36500 [Salipiger pallidus]
MPAGPHKAAKAPKTEPEQTGNKRRQEEEKKRSRKDGASRDPDLFFALSS